MFKQKCPVGKLWDSLLMTCVRPRKKPRRVTRPPPPPLASDKPTDRSLSSPVSFLSPPALSSPSPPSLSSGSTSATSAAPWSTQGRSVWSQPQAVPYPLAATVAVVAVVALGSVLALVLWLLIYRRHRKRSRLPPPAVELTNHTDPPAKAHQPLVPRSYPEETVHEEPEPCCLHLDYHNGSADFWHVDDITSYPEMLKPGLIWVGENGANGRKHRIPLPATELGDTTLVTAKTGRNQ